MKNLMLVILAAAMGAAVSAWWNQHAAVTKMITETSAENSAEKKPLYWVAPMDPNFRRDEPGLSPMGMELVPVYEEADNSSPGTVTISPAVEAQMGVTTARVEVLPWLEQRRAFAEVAIDTAQQWHVQIRAPGWIEKSHVFAVGETVVAGQPLFDFYSPELVVAQEEFLVALADGEASLIRSAEERLLALNLPRGWIQRLRQRKTIEERVRFVAQKAGVISHWDLAEGRFVAAGSAVISIADLSQLWLDVHLLKPMTAQQISQTRLRLLGDQSKPLLADTDNATLVPLLNNQRAQVWRLPLDNRAGLWHPGDYLNLELSLQQAAVLQLPSQAVIDDGIQPRVVLALGEGRYKSVAVQLGRHSSVAAADYSQRREILAGLAPGDRVVTSGQFLLDSESSIQSDLLRFYPLQQSQADIIWMEAELKLPRMPQDGTASRLEIRHQGVKPWGWPAMNQNVHLALSDEQISALKLSTQRWSDAVRIKLAALDDGDFCVVDVAGLGPDSERMKRHDMDLGGMDHSGMDHSGMDHSGMDHSGMDHSGMDHSGMDHSGMDHKGMNHD